MRDETSLKRIPFRVCRCCRKIGEKDWTEEMSGMTLEENAMKKEKKITYFGLTLEECKNVFDAIDGLVVIDHKGIIKYLSPDLFDALEELYGIELPQKVVGKSTPPAKSAAPLQKKNSRKPISICPMVSSVLPESSLFMTMDRSQAPSTMICSRTAGSCRALRKS